MKSIELIIAIILGLICLFLSFLLIQTNNNLKTSKEEMEAIKKEKLKYDSLFIDSSYFQKVKNNLELIKAQEEYASRPPKVDEEIKVIDGMNMGLNYYTYQKDIIKNPNLASEPALVKIPAQELLSLMNALGPLDPSNPSYIAGVFGRTQNKNCLILYPCDAQFRIKSDYKKAHEIFPEIHFLLGMDSKITDDQNIEYLNLYNYYFRLK